MKNVNVYNSSVYPVVISLYGNAIDFEPKETIQIETDVWFGDDNFKIAESNSGQRWEEAYMGRYNQNLILRMEDEPLTYSFNG